MLLYAYGLYQPASHIKLTCKYFEFQLIRFKFQDRIKQRPINFQSMIPGTTHGQRTNAYKSARGSWLTYLTIILFTHISPRTKSKGLLIGSLLFSKKLYFYIRSTTYKKQGAPDRRSLTEQKFILFTRVAPRTKSKGLPIDAPHIFYYFQHVLHHVQKVRGSIGMCSKFIILLTKFSKVFTAQQVSSSMVWLYPKPHERVS
jgi:hypothetical protein